MAKTAAACVAESKSSCDVGSSIDLKMVVTPRFVPTAAPSGWRSGCMIDGFNVELAREVEGERLHVTMCAGHGGIGGGGGDGGGGGEVGVGGDGGGGG
eukprot:3505489-Pleurochrysis_carterae.AAC.3